MYKKPDFIKVNIDIKENFANYTQCMANKDWGGGQFTTATTDCSDGNQWYGIAASQGGSANEQCWIIRNDVMG